MRLIWCNMALTTPRRIVRSSIFSARNRLKKSAVCWSQNCSPSVRAAGQVSRRTSMTRKDSLKKAAMMKSITSASSLIMVSACSCWNLQGGIGEAFHIVDGSTFAIREGYHPCVVAPGYEMYYFTILGGLSQRPLVQFSTLIMPGRSKRSRASRI